MRVPVRVMAGVALLVCGPPSGPRPMMGARGTTVPARGLPFVTALAAAAGGSEGTDPEAFDAAAFRRAFDSRSARERRRALGLLRGRPGAEATTALLPALGDRDADVAQRARDLLDERRAPQEVAVLVEIGLRVREPVVRILCAEHLVSCGDLEPAAVKALVRSLRDPEPRVRAAVADTLGGCSSSAVARDLAAALRREGDGLVRASLLEALARRDPDAATKESLRVTGRDREGPPCVAALRHLRAVGSGGSGGGDGGVSVASVAEDLLSHPAWEVRLEAARTLGAERSQAARSIPALIAALEDEKRTRVRGALGEALESLSGAPWGTDVERWTSWWREHASGFRPPPRRAGPAGGHGDGAEGGSRARFYDIPLESDRVAFVIDTSRSMRDSAEPGGRATKMELAVANTASTLAGLDDGTWINVITFGTQVRRWKPACIPGGLAARGDALRWLQRRTLEGRTNIFDALAAAMEDPRTDTVCLLTDGAPTAGEETTRTGFLRGLRRLRRWRPVRIHCVEIGGGNTGKRWRGFLEEVAMAADGVHVSR